MGEIAKQGSSSLVKPRTKFMMCGWTLFKDSHSWEEGWVIGLTHPTKCNKFWELPSNTTDTFSLDFHLPRWKPTTSPSLHAGWHLWAHLLAPLANPSPNILQEHKWINCFSDVVFDLEILRVKLRVSSTVGFGIARTQTGALGFYLSCILGSVCHHWICCG